VERGFGSEHLSGDGENVAHEFREANARKLIHRNNQTDEINLETIFFIPS
jgi:hypothetical protein